MTYSDRLHSLFQLEFFGMKLGLENIHRLLDFLGHPERRFPSIHVAGTNGKGSVSAMLAAIYQADGKRTGLYTSPHLVDFRERIRIDGKPITEKFVTGFLASIWPKVEELRATFFEVTTAMAFDYFASQQVDIAIIETGLGGRLDATNILERPLATVITSIGIDHTEQLGSTLGAIAGEKAGIFKIGIPAIVNCEPILNRLFIGKANEQDAPLLFVRDWKVPDGFNHIRPSLEGEHQEENLKTVLATLSVLEERPTLESIRRGVAETALLSGLRARLEEVRSPELTERGLRLFLDVGHNESAFRSIADYFTKNGLRPVVIAGLMKDKDIRSIIRTIAGFAIRLVAVQAGTSRALPSDDLTREAKSIGIESYGAGNVMAGIEYAMETANSGDLLLLTGSHYVVGEFLKNFQETGLVVPKAIATPVLPK